MIFYVRRLKARGIDLLEEPARRAAPSTTGAKAPA